MHNINVNITKEDIRKNILTICIALSIVMIISFIFPTANWGNINSSPVPQSITCEQLAEEIPELKNGEYALVSEDPDDKDLYFYEVHRGIPPQNHEASRARIMESATLIQKIQSGIEGYIIGIAPTEDNKFMILYYPSMTLSRDSFADYFLPQTSLLSILYPSSSIYGIPYGSYIQSYPYSSSSPLTWGMFPDYFTSPVPLWNSLYAGSSIFGIPYGSYSQLYPFDRLGSSLFFASPPPFGVQMGFTNPLLTDPTWYILSQIIQGNTPSNNRLTAIYDSPSVTGIEPSRNGHGSIPFLNSLWGIPVSYGMSNLFQPTIPSIPSMESLGWGPYSAFLICIGNSMNTMPYEK